MDSDNSKNQEHPWIHQARTLKQKAKPPKEGERAAREDDVVLPKSDETPLWGPVVAASLLLVILIVSVRLAFALPPDTSSPPPVARTVRVWHDVEGDEALRLDEVGQAFTQRSGALLHLERVQLTSEVLGAVYRIGGPDLLLVDLSFARQLAEHGALLSPDGALLPPSARRDPNRYFLPLTAGSAWTRPLGVVMMRTAEDPQLAAEFAQHLAATLRTP